MGQVRKGLIVPQGLDVKGQRCSIQALVTRMLFIVVDDPTWTTLLTTSTFHARIAVDPLHNGTHTQGELIWSVSEVGRRDVECRRASRKHGFGQLVVFSDHERSGRPPQEPARG